MSFSIKCEHSEMASSYVNAVIVLGLLGWTVFLASRAKRRVEQGNYGFLVTSLALIAVYRGLFMIEIEPNADTSTWLASAITVNQRSDAAWTLLTYSDSRPLTVLPLVVALKLGAPASYVMAEVVGLLFWLGSIFTCYQIFRLHLPASGSLLACWTLCLFIGTAGYSEYIAYNSEAFAVFLTTGATYGALQILRRNSIPVLGAGALGGLIGFFPYEKMQIAPAGLVLAGFVAVVLARQRAWPALGALLVGGVLPTAVIIGYYAGQHEWNSFWDTYFWRYYYYSFSEEISPMTVGSRFHPGRAASFIFGNGWSALYLTALVMIIVVGMVALRWGRGPQISRVAAHSLILTSLLVCVTVYSVLQSGYNYEHYILLLLVPLLHAACLVLSLCPAPWRGRLIMLGLVSISLQGAFNAWFRQPLFPLPTARADERITRLLLAHSAPGESMVVCGYADRFHVLAHRPMGYRYANTFYIYSPLIALKNHDLRHFFHDLDHNRPSLLVDAMSPGISTYGQLDDSKRELFPGAAAYLDSNYILVDATDGVRIFRRRDQPVGPPEIETSTENGAPLHPRLFPLPTAARSKDDSRPPPSPQAR